MLSGSAAHLPQRDAATTAARTRRIPGWVREVALRALL
jgi:hypothetical protein